MKNLVWLLFLPGFLCDPNPLKIKPDSLVTWKGSCVVIPCQIYPYKGVFLRHISLLWYFQPFYDMNHSEYYGLLLFNSSATSSNRNRSPSAFAGRLEFVGNVQNSLEKKNCSLKISHLLTEDSGIYGARLSASYNRPVQQSKWFLNATVHVAESPPDPKMDINIREGWTRVTCSVPYHCPEELLNLTISGLGGTRLSSQRTTINDGVIQTVVSLQMTLDDHGKSLVCSLKRQNGLELSKSTILLGVKSPLPGVPVPPLPPSQPPHDGRTLWEEFSFLSESQNQAVKAHTQFIHSCKELTPAVIHLMEQFRKALLQIRQRTSTVPRAKKKP